MPELHLIIFVGVSISWHVLDESRFNISFSVSGFEILLNLNYLFVLSFFIGSSIWLIFTDWSCNLSISNFCFRYSETYIQKVTMMLRKSDNPVPTVQEFWKLLLEFFSIRSQTCWICRVFIACWNPNQTFYSI